MKILAVEDDPVARRVLHQALKKLDHEVVLTSDGEQAREVLVRKSVRVVVSDWVMPKVDGLERCRRIRARTGADPVDVMPLTSRTAHHDNQREAADAGVDEFLTKPLDLNERWMRLRVAERTLRFAPQAQHLETFLPVCSYGKKARNDENYWQQIEGPINKRPGTDFSHSVRPDCYKAVVLPELEQHRAAQARAIPHVDRTN